MKRRRTVPPSAAIVALLASLALVLHTAREAIEIEPMLLGAPGVLPPVSVPRPASDVPAARLVRAVEKAPFRAGRTAPTERFRLPGEASIVAKVPSDQPSGPFQLIGTAVIAGGRGFAMCQQGGEPPRLVRIGERIGELKLEHVTQGRAIFADASGRRTELRVPKVGS